MSSQQLLRLLRSRAPQIRCYAAPPKPRRPSRPPPAIRPAKRQTPTEKAALQSPQPVQQQTSNLRPATALAEPESGQTHDPIAAVMLDHHQPPQPSRDFVYNPNASYVQNSANVLLGDAESLLLYRAPKHTALFTSSAIIGPSLFFWVGTVANDVFVNYTVPWYAKMVVLAGCLVGSGMASSITATPTNLIRSISLVRKAEDEVVLRFEGNRLFPFLKPNVFDLPPGQPIVDSNVTGTLESGGSYMNVQSKRGQAWTAGELIRPDQPQGENIFQRLNRSLVNVSPAAKSQVRKMFNREGMAYIRIGNFNWKMDMEKCEILEHGAPLEKLTRKGAIRKNLASMLGLRGV